MRLPKECVTASSLLTLYFIWGLFSLHFYWHEESATQSRSDYTKYSDSQGIAAFIVEALCSCFIPLRQKYFKNHLYLLCLSIPSWPRKSHCLDDNYSFLLDQAIVTQNSYTSTFYFHYFIIKVKVISVTLKLQKFWPSVIVNVILINQNHTFIMFIKCYPYIKQWNTIQKQFFIYSVDLIHYFSGK